MIKIDELKANVDIVDVVNARVPLKKSGANHMACCPFHSEKTPSFSVSQSKQFYFCFGCGAGGDVVDFIKNYEHVDFVTAAKILGGEEIEGDYQRPEPKIKEPWQIEIEKRNREFKARQLQEHISDMHYADKKPMYDYFASRGITNIESVLSNDIGFLEQCYLKEEDIYLQAIFSLVKNRYGHIVSGHRTYLKNGEVYKGYKKLMGSVVDGVTNGCAIRLISSDSSDLNVGEGQESILSVFMLNKRQDANYWSTISSGGMKRLSISGEYNNIGIYADMDRKSRSGHIAAQSLASRYDARVYYPSKKIPDGQDHFDFNDLLMMKKGLL